MKRIAFACLLAGLSLTACGGGGGATGNTLPGTVPTPTGGAVPAMATSNPDGTLQGNGPIAGTFAGGFTLNTGSSHGLVHIYTNASTVITGAKPFTNEQVQVTGTGSWAKSVTATAVSQVQTTQTVTATPTPATASTPSPAIIATPSPRLVSTQGPIVALGTGRFEINSGSPHGYMWIAYNASTTFTGTKTAPVVGQYAQISGTGSLSSTPTAVIVTSWSAAPSPASATGTIVAGTPYGFTLNVDSTHTAVPVIVTGTTVVAGGTLQAGSSATVTGTGGPSGSFTAVQIVVTNPTPPPALATPTPGPISQKHILNADYLAGANGTTSIAWTTAAQYLTWAQTDVAHASAISAAGIKTQFYTDPNRTQTNDPLYTSDESTFAHDCSGNRVTDIFNNRVTQYVMDPNSADMQSLYHSKTLSQIGSAHFDAIYQDDNGPLSDFGNIFTPSLPCNYSDSSWITGGMTLNNSAPLPVIINGLNVLNGHNPSMAISLLASSNTMGGNYEHCYSDDASAKNNGWLWTAEENSELQVNAQNKVFSCQERNTSDASANTDARLYAYASFLLTYNPTTNILWEAFGTPSNFHVFPEQQLVAMNPKVSAPSDISGLMQSGGAYGREYQNCYYAGNYVGPCAVAVNPNASGTVPFPFPQYQHTLVLNGYGTTDGGTAALNGAAPPTYLPALGAAVVFQ